MKISRTLIIMNDELEHPLLLNFHNCVSFVTDNKNHPFQTHIDDVYKNINLKKDIKISVLAMDNQTGEQWMSIRNRKTPRFETHKELHNFINDIWEKEINDETN